MLEVLVSVIVLAIGFLGMALMQSNSIRGNQDAYLQSVAVNQLYNMADRMRANPTAAQAGSYNFGSTMPADPSCSPCTQTETAQYDAYQWDVDNKAYLPIGTTGSSSISYANGRYTIGINYDRRKTNTASPTCPPSGTTANPDVYLTCLTLDIAP